MKELRWDNEVPLWLYYTHSTLMPGPQRIDPPAALHAGAEKPHGLSSRRTKGPASSQRVEKEGDQHNCQDACSPIRTTYVTFEANAVDDIVD